jgi:hypothetical protein
MNPIARADPSAFCEDKTGGRPLSIVFNMKLGGREFGIARAAARHGGHRHPVSELKFAERVGSEKRLFVRQCHVWCSGKMLLLLGGSRLVRLATVGG